MHLVQEEARDVGGTDHLTRAVVVHMTDDEYAALHSMAVRNTTGSRQGMVRKLIRSAWAAYEGKGKRR